MTALLIPDFAAALAAPNGQTTGKRYAAWFDEQLGSLYHPQFDGNDCWRFRCGLLHQGRMRPHKGSRHERVIFAEPDTGLVMHRGSFTNIGPEQQTGYVVDIRLFTYEILWAAREWLRENRELDPVRENLRQVVRRHPAGIAPFIVSTPVYG